MVGIIEEEEEVEKAAKTALDLEKKRNNEELSAQISKINFSKYLPNSEVMPVEDYIEIDDKEESTIEMNNNDIFNMVNAKRRKRNRNGLYST